MLAIELKLKNGKLVAKKLTKVGRRFARPRDGFEDALDVLEQAHERHFGLLDGRYELTGKTMRSLTGSNPMAIRKLLPEGAIFGSKVPQATFLSKAPDDPWNAQIRKGAQAPTPKGTGKPFAVLVLPRASQKRIAQVLLDYITEPVRA